MAEARCDAGDLALGEFTTTTQKQWTVSWLVDALSPVKHKGLYQGRRRLS